MTDRYNELIERIAEIDALVVLKRSEIRALHQEQDALVKEKDALDIPTFDSIYDIKWVQETEHNQETVWWGEKFKPWKDARVGDKLYRRGNANQQPDWYAIAHRRAAELALIDGAHAMLVVDDDDSWESDWDDMVKAVQEYEGTLRQPLSSWDSSPIGAKLKVEYLKTHTDPGVEFSKRNPVVLAAYGNLSVS